MAAQEELEFGFEREEDQYGQPAIAVEVAICRRLACSETFDLADFEVVMLANMEEPHKDHLFLPTTNLMQGETAVNGAYRVTNEQTHMSGQTVKLISMHAQASGSAHHASSQHQAQASLLHFVACNKTDTPKDTQRSKAAFYSLKLLNEKRRFHFLPQHRELVKSTISWLRLQFKSNTIDALFNAGKRRKTLGDVMLVRPDTKAKAAAAESEGVDDGQAAAERSDTTSTGSEGARAERDSIVSTSSSLSRRMQQAGFTEFESSWDSEGMQHPYAEDLLADFSNPLAGW